MISCRWYNYINIRIRPCLQHLSCIYPIYQFIGIKWHIHGTLEQRSDTFYDNLIVFEIVGCIFPTTAIKCHILSVFPSDMGIINNINIVMAKCLWKNILGEWAYPVWMKSISWLVKYVSCWYYIFIQVNNEYMYMCWVALSYLPCNSMAKLIE